MGQYMRLFLGEEEHELTFGARHMGALADNSDYSYDDREGLARMDLKLSPDVTLSPQASFAQTFYQGPATALETSDRQDDRLGLGVDFHTPSRRPGAQSLAIATPRLSNSTLYDYDRHVATMGVAFSF